MQCAKCGTAFPDGSTAKAFISVLVMSDEYIYSYWLCAECDHYSVESYLDRLMGGEEITVLPPVSREVGDRALALIHSCPDPSDKNCDCASHQALYTGLPR